MLRTAIMRFGSGWRLVGDKA